MKNTFRYFNSSPEVIRLAVMMYIRYPLSLRQVEDLLCQRRSKSTPLAGVKMHHRGGVNTVHLV